VARDVLSGPARQAATAACAIAGGAACLLWNGIGLAAEDLSGGSCSSPSDYAGDATFAAAGVLVGAALLGIATLLLPLQRWIATVAGAASATFVVANGVEHCGYEPLSLLYVLGATVSTLAVAALGIAWLITGAMGRWRGLLLIAAAAAPMLLQFDGGGAALSGASWVLFGLSLLVARPAVPAARRAS
jgi:hypothetical protein